jgi:hypothetical protein
LTSLPYFGSFTDAFAVESLPEGEPLVEEAPFIAGCAEAGDFSCDAAGPGDSGEVAVLAPDCDGWFVTGGAVGETVEGLACMVAGASDVPPVVAGFCSDAETAPCPAVVDPAVAADEGVDCATVAGGLEVCSAGFEDAAGAELGEGGNSSEGKTTEFTTEGSSWSFT